MDFYRDHHYLLFASFPRRNLSVYLDLLPRRVPQKESLYSKLLRSRGINQLGRKPHNDTAKVTFSLLSLNKKKTNSVHDARRLLFFPFQDCI